MSHHLQQYYPRTRQSCIRRSFTYINLAARHIGGHGSPIFPFTWPTLQLAAISSANIFIMFCRNKTRATWGMKLRVALAFINLNVRGLSTAAVCRWYCLSYMPLDNSTGAHVSKLVILRLKSCASPSLPFFGPTPPPHPRCENAAIRPA